MNTAHVRPYVCLYDHEFVVMPNHIHGIIWIVNDGGMKYEGAAPLRPYPPSEAAAFGHDTARKGIASNVPAASLSSIVRSFKSNVTKRINRIRNTPGAVVWQRNYFEHIIRTRKSLSRIRFYIACNPFKWDEDPDNPRVVSEKQKQRNSLSA